MQTLGPYRLDRLLGSCPAGRVWHGVDPAGAVVAIAVLDPAPAADPRWRDAFVATANRLARSGAISAVSGDFTAPTPWFACRPGSPGPEQVFTALGQEYRPLVSPSSPPPGPPPEPPTEPPTAATQPVSLPASAPPAAVARVRPPAAGPPAGSPWDRTYSPATYSAGVSAPPISGEPASPSYPGGAPAPFTGPGRPGAAAARSRAWLGVLLLVLLLPGAGGAIIAASMRPSAASPAPRASASKAQPAATFVTPKPARPGLEPPKDGTWPGWPAFTAADRATATKLSGFGFTFDLPPTWQCRPTDRATGFARYTCTDGAGVSVDTLVRSCPRPCDSTRRSQLRQAEEAFGLRWIRAGPLTTWAETNQLDGAGRYGLVFVTFWHSSAEGVLDRELVFRATGPADHTDEVRKVADSIHQALT